MLKIFNARWGAARTFAQYKNVIKTKKKVIQHIGEPLITCKRTDFNLHSGDKVDLNAKFGNIPLASDGWHHYKSKGDFFMIHQHQLSEDITLHPIYKQPFDKFDIHPQLLVNLSSRLSMQYTTYIQHQALPKMLSNEHTLIAAETGCGKTIAYLLPIIQNVLKQKNTADKEANPEFNTPKVLILTPSRELAQQIGNVCEDLCHDLDIKTKVLIGGHTKSVMMNPPVDEIDVLVASIGSLSKLLFSQTYRMHQVRHVVLDEADTLLDDSFQQKLMSILKRFPVSFSVKLHVLFDCTNQNDFHSCSSTKILSISIQMK